MTQTGAYAGPIADFFQSTITTLGRERERILGLVEAAKQQHERMGREVAYLEQNGRGEVSPEVVSLLGSVESLCAQMVRQGESVEAQMSELERSLAREFKEIQVILQNAEQGKAFGLHAIRVQEEERRRLAREIHDGPTQLLNSVVLRIDVCQRLLDADPARLKAELQQLKELVRLSLQDVRKVIYDLRPMTLDDLGLIPAVRTFLMNYQGRTGIETDFAAFGSERRYDPTFEVALFRIVQESLNNVSKHAGASKVWVKVETTGGKRVKLSVRDDGVGFDPEQVSTASGPGFGLVAMRERTELLGGTMEILSSPGQGTRLNFIFPLPDQEGQR